MKRDLSVLREVGRQSFRDLSKKTLSTLANTYLETHPRANAALHKEKLIKRLRRLHLQAFSQIILTSRSLVLTIDSQKQEALAQHDGCYVLKTDVPKDSLPKEAVHARYKDLAKVESAFRTIKTGMLEIRPLYVRKESKRRHLHARPSLPHSISKFPISALRL